MPGMYNNSWYEIYWRAKPTVVLTPVEPLNNGHFGTLLLQIGYPLLRDKLYCHDPVGTTELILYVVLCPLRLWSTTNYNEPLVFSIQYILSIQPNM